MTTGRPSSCRTPRRAAVVAPVLTDYGMREFAVVDRSGNLVRIGTPETDPTHAPDTDHRGALSEL
jgi:hypothetical protein